MFSAMKGSQASGCAGYRKFVRIAATITIACALQACSTSREQGDGSSWKLWGSDSEAKRDRPTSDQATKQASRFDMDGPPAREPVYRGGRDPVTGRANDWPPAAPAPVAQSNLPPVQPYTPPPAYAAQPPAYAAPSYPQAASTPPPYSPPPYATAPYPAAQPPVAAARPALGSPTSVEVRQGDTLYRIAKSHNVTVAALMQANGLANESIKVGQRLTIPVQ